MKNKISHEIKFKIFNERKGGKSYGKIANLYGLSKGTVQRIIDSYDKRKAKRGRKEKLNKHDIRRLGSFVKDNFRNGIKTNQHQF